MDYRIRRAVQIIFLALGIFSFLFFSGCARMPPKWPVEKYVSKLEHFIDSNNVSNLLIVTKSKSDWCQRKNNNATCIISSYEIIYSFDERFFIGDQIVTLNELTENSGTKMPHSFKTENCSLREKNENLFFASFDVVDIIKIDERIVFPSKEDPCLQRTYYLDSPVFPYPFEVIMNDVDGLFQMEPDKAINAYLSLREQYRQKRKGAKSPKGS